MFLWQQCWQLCSQTPARPPPKAIRPLAQGLLRAPQASILMTARSDLMPSIAPPRVRPIQPSELGRCKITQPALPIPLADLTPLPATPLATTIPPREGRRWRATPPATTIPPADLTPLSATPLATKIPPADRAPLP